MESKSKALITLTLLLVWRVVLVVSVVSLMRFSKFMELKPREKKLVCMRDSGVVAHAGHLKVVSSNGTKKLMLYVKMSLTPLHLGFSLSNRIGGLRTYKF